jgi:hypothetical protein
VRRKKIFIFSCGYWFISPRSLSCQGGLDAQCRFPSSSIRLLISCNFAQSPHDWNMSGLSQESIVRRIFWRIASDFRIFSSTIGRSRGRTCRSPQISTSSSYLFRKRFPRSRISSGVIFRPGSKNLGRSPGGTPGCSCCVTCDLRRRKIFRILKAIELGFS